MCPTLYRRIHMVIRIASKVGAFFCIVTFVVVNNLRLGAVLIKNYASLDKKEKSSTCFFLKLLPFKYSKNSVRTQRNQKGTKERTGTPFPCNFFPTASLSKLTPAGKKLQWWYHVLTVFCNIVARGHSLRLPLQILNCEFAASSGENCLAANKKMPSKMTKLLTPLMVAPSCNVWGQRPPTKDNHPSPKTPPNAGCTINPHIRGLLLDGADVSILGLCRLWCCRRRLLNVNVERQQFKFAAWTQQGD